MNSEEQYSDSDGIKSLYDEIFSDVKLSLSDFSETEDTESDINLKTLNGLYELNTSKIFKCDIITCGQNFRRQKDLDSHKYKHTGKKERKCIIHHCDKVYITESALIRHMKKTHEYSSTQLKEVFPNNRLIPRKYKCDLDGCTKEFLRRDGFDAHIYSHTGIKANACSINKCTKSYITITSLKRHIRLSHIGTTIKCQDNSCGKSFEKHNQMLKHFNRFHKEKKTFTCDQCNEKFNRKTQLNLHYFKHTKQYPYTCTECSKGFILRWKLNRHKQTHNSKVCDICKKSFKRWTELVEHNSSEHGKGRTCNVCKKTFSNKSNLRVHKKIHLEKDDRPIFSCTYEGCGKFYFQSNTLNAHVKSKHEGVVFKCTFSGCKSELSTKQKLTEHIQKVHNNSNSIKKPKTIRKRTEKLKRNTSKRFSTASFLADVIVPPEVNKEIIKGYGEHIVIDATSDLESVCVSESEDENVCKNIATNCHSFRTVK